MKVAYVTMEFPSPTETFASQDVRMLREKGVEVEVHGLRPRPRDFAALRAARGLNAVPVSANGVGPTLRGVGAMLRELPLALGTVAWLLRRGGHTVGQRARALALLPRAFDVLRGLRREPPDVLHVYWSHYPALVGRLVQRRLPGTVVSASLGAYDLERALPFAADVLHEAAVIRTHARANVERVAAFAGVPRSRVSVIYNGVDLARVDRTLRSVTRVPRRLVTAGRLIERKGMRDVLDAFARVRRDWPDATLHVLGDGPDAAALRSHAAASGLGADAVRFLGHVDHDRVLEELAAAEGLLLLTRASGERLPNAVKEGMAAGCVCVTTPTVGLEELLEHEREGFVVPMERPDEAAAAVDRFFADEALRTRVTQHARERIERDFDVWCTSDRYAVLWAGAMQRPVRVPAARQPAAT